MRAVIPIAVVLCLAAAVAVKLNDTHSWLGPSASVEIRSMGRVAGVQGAPAPSGEVRAPSEARRGSTPTNVPSHPAPLRTVAVPPPMAPATELPATLELVSLPTVPGAKAAAPRTISRAEAVASVIASREFQETVTPIARLYLATFGRFPDYEGMNYYTGQREEARPLAAIADEFVGSREFRERYGQPDNAEFVALVFRNVLGHESQADVRAYWIEELSTGRMTRGQVLIDLAESGAFRDRSANHVMVSTAYLEVLRRTPDPEGHARWVARLNAGQPWRSVIDGLLAGGH